MTLPAFGRVPAGEPVLEPIGEARAELLREVKQLLAEWEADRHPTTRGMLLARLESLKAPCRRRAVIW